MTFSHASTNSILRFKNHNIWCFYLTYSRKCDIVYPVIFRIDIFLS